jgi:hypothetical protein
MRERETERERQRERDRERETDREREREREREYASTHALSVTFARLKSRVPDIPCMCRFKLNCTVMSRQV